MKSTTSTDISSFTITAVPRWVLRGNALWLTIGATGGLLMDVLGIFFGTAHKAESSLSRRTRASGSLKLTGSRSS